jgi:hypothetical protein
MIGSFRDEVVVSPLRRPTVMVLDIVGSRKFWRKSCRESLGIDDAAMRAGHSRSDSTTSKEYVMRFMCMVKAAENQPIDPPPPALFAAMAAYSEEGLRTGVLVDQGGLLPSAAGAIVSLADGIIKAVDGPFTEAREVVGGYAVIEVPNKAAAVEHARRLMQIHADHWPGYVGSCEIRQLMDQPAG